MRIKLKQDWGSAKAGDVVDAALRADGNAAYFFDSESTGWYLLGDQFEFIGDAIPYRPPSSMFTTKTTETPIVPQVTLRDLIGQDISEIKLK